jgi:hypothetical protein
LCRHGRARQQQACQQSDVTKPCHGWHSSFAKEHLGP